MLCNRLPAINQPCSKVENRCTYSISQRCRCSILFILPVIMWTCSVCSQQFKNTNQVHSCLDKELSDFLNGKSEQTLSLFWHFVESYRKIADVTIHPTKSMIAFAATTRIAYVIRFGKNFVDIVFPFDQAYSDNLCFTKIAQVPGSQQFNHHFRMYNKEDINAEVKDFMKRAYESGR
jgi:Domain of unknown function (DUF5655)